MVGSGLLVSGTGLGSVKAPGTAYGNDILGRDPQPAHMDNYVRTTRDNGGIHINCGVPNRAFCLVAERLGGRAWEGAGRIWWDALTGAASEGGCFSPIGRGSPLLRPPRAMAQTVSSTGQCSTPGTRSACLWPTEAVSLEV